MKVDEVLLEFMQSADSHDEDELQKCLTYIKDNYKTKIDEVILGDENLTQYVNELIDGNDKNLADYLRNNLQVQQLNAYSYDYKVEAKECGVSFADTELQYKLNLSFGAHYSNLISQIELAYISYVIGFLNGGYDAAIWVISGPGLFTRVYSRIDGVITVYQSQNASVDPHAIWIACRDFLTEYKHSATSSGLRTLLMEYEFQLNPNVTPNWNKDDCTIDFDKVRSIFNIDKSEDLSGVAYTSGDDSICLVYPESKEFLIVMSSNDGVIIRTDLTSFSDLKFRLLTSLSNMTATQLVRDLANVGNALIPYEVKPFTINNRKTADTSVESTESLTYKFGNNKVKISKVGSLNYQINLELDGDLSSFMIESKFSAMELMKSISSTINSLSSLQPNQLRYQIALKLLSISKLI